MALFQFSCQLRNISPEKHAFLCGSVRTDAAHEWEKAAVISTSTGSSLVIELYSFSYTYMYLVER